VQACWLLKGGVPFVLAFGESPAGLSQAEKDAIAIKLSEFEGARFNLHSMSFEER